MSRMVCRSQRFFPFKPSRLVPNIKQKSPFPKNHHHRLTTNHAPKTCNASTIPTTLPLPRLAPASMTRAVPHRACAVVGRLSPFAISVVQNPPCCITVVVGLFPTTTAPPPLYAVVVCAAGATYCARLRKTGKRIAQMADIKKECDQLAHKGAQRVAQGGFAGLISWWVGVW